MNIILIFSEDFADADSIVRLKGRRMQHIKDVHKAREGDCLEVGLAGGKTGKGMITAIKKDFIEIKTDFTSEPPEPLPVNLLLALPRPKVLSRVIQAAVTIGIKKIWLINAFRVEKSYWQSPRLEKQNLTDRQTEGLEQAKDTLFPEIHIKKLFRPFVEDELPEIIKGTEPIVAHPGTATPVSRFAGKPVTIAIGPEGGFIPYEVEKLIECGFTPVTTGQRILRVETVIPYIIGSLCL